MDYREQKTRAAIDALRAMCRPRGAGAGEGGRGVKRSVAVFVAVVSAVVFAAWMGGWNFERGTDGLFIAVTSIFLGVGLAALTKADEA